MHWKQWDEELEDDDDRHEPQASAYRPDLREREICPDCNGTGLDYLSLSFGADAGGSCPSCIGGRRI